MNDKKSNNITPSILGDVSGLSPFTLPHLKADRRMMVGGHITQIKEGGAIDSLPRVSVFVMEDADTVGVPTEGVCNALDVLQQGFKWTLEIGEDGVVTNFTDSSGVEKPFVLPWYDEPLTIDVAGVRASLNGICYPIWEQLRNSGSDLSWELNPVEQKEREKTNQSVWRSRVFRNVRASTSVKGRKYPCNVKHGWRYGISSGFTLYIET